MLDWLREFLVKYPEFTLFLTIGVGYWIGSLRFGGFSLGAVTGSLFAGVAIGQLAHVPVSGTTKSVLFLLFLFGIGYSVGPQFMQALKRGGWRPVVLTMSVSATGLITAWAVSSVLRLDPGFAAGLLAGALTESPAIGTATEAINNLPLPEAERARLIAHIAVADAVCYMFGAVGMIWFCSSLGPRLLGIDLREESQKLERELGILRAKPGVASAWRAFELRAYRVAEDGVAVGLTIAEAERRIPAQRFFLHRLRRGTEVLDPAPNFRLQAGDVVALSGRREILVELIGGRADEVEDRELLDVPVAVYDILASHKDIVGRSLEELSALDWTRGIYLRGIIRGGQEIPLATSVYVQRGDLLRIVGPDNAVAQAAAHIGTVVQPTEATDFVVLGIAIFLGGVIGTLVQLPIGNMQIALSTGVGTLLAGLTVGHLRTRLPLFGRIPDGAVSLMTSLGLAAFVALTGLHAGPIFFEALVTAGVGLLFGGMIVTLTPMFVGLYVGHYLLKMNPVLLLGGLAGAQTFTAAMAAIQDKSGSPVAVLGYTPTYPLGHIVLTIWGTVIVSLVAR